MLCAKCASKCFDNLQSTNREAEIKALCNILKRWHSSIARRLLLLNCRLLEKYILLSNNTRRKNICLIRKIPSLNICCCLMSKAIFMQRASKFNAQLKSTQVRLRRIAQWFQNETEMYSMFYNFEAIQNSIRCKFKT